ncbi:hypothetical protein BO70DRAFT_383778 [Aspergillus heteromorphus CBS 117.55]|uniref:Uncharacterized protein n=1 Tax=Aspergillus heteromorphus CBS 117.55 TaxID=1448321 RepID=A0A317X1V4_9EURO|nr:uncharacterized protein BO70DRAFT_383778 [Aspergillus heteromorphus CBS 117.55]PWY92111.1 hypothetical protein BO70DRAFT_383778 [Aspergillus heteromorphus CBS 117.55]
MCLHVSVLKRLLYNANFSQMVYYLGKLLGQIGRPDDSRKTDLLMRAQKGGFIQWHILGTEQKIILFSHRANCMDLLQLRVDLELESFQIAHVGSGLENAGFVNRFEMHAAGPDEPLPCSEKRTITATRPILSRPLPPSIPMSESRLSNPADNIPLDVAPNSEMGNTHGYSHFPRREAELPLEMDTVLNKSAICTPPDKALLTSYPGFGIASPAETVPPHMLNRTTCCHPKSDTTCFDSSPRERLTGIRSVLRKQSDPTILALLEYCCGANLSEKQLKKIFEANKCFSSQASRELLDKRDKSLDPVARRIGLIILYFNYYKIFSTYILDYILNTYHNNPCISKSNNATFTEAQISVLVTLVLNTRPGTIRIFQKLESVIKFLIFRQITQDLRQAILKDETTEDEAAAACQQTKTFWTKVNAKHVAREKMNKLLANVL